MANRGRPLVLGMDAGGTMTDTIVVDEHGNFAIGKALTTPQDESVGFFRSVWRRSQLLGLSAGTHLSRTRSLDLRRDDNIKHSAPEEGA